MFRKLRMGMIGGGIGSFIGEVHRIVSRMDNRIELVCGAFSSTSENSKKTGEQLGLDKNRVYSNYKEMLQKESQLPNDIKPDFFCIATPNHLHYDNIKTVTEYGFHIVCDKPLCYSLDEAYELKKIIEQKNVLFCLTHTYALYPMVLEAKKIVADGKIGKIRKIVVEYPQSWLSQPIEKENHKQAMWRLDPKKSGISCCMADIGTHAFNLAEHIAGLKVTELCASVNTFVEGRHLDDDGEMLLKFENGATGYLWASQIATGEENNLRIRLYGEKGGLLWQQADVNTLKLMLLNKPAQIYRTGNDYLSNISLDNTRVPPGHPEGYLEAFANIYTNFSNALEEKLTGKKKSYFYMGIEEGMRGMAFVETVIKSSKSDRKWWKLQV